MKREAMLAAACGAADVVVIGGGATGAGIAWEAASRGLRAVLLEARDFGAGTSSRSTKLIHGGVRYLAQGRLGLVREALHERALLRHNAPTLVRALRFVVPVASLLERVKFRGGLAAYDLLAGHSDFPRSAWLSRREMAAAVPGLRAEEFAGAVSFHDGQFDDTALLFAVLRAAADLGATCVNYAEVTALLKRADGRVCGVAYLDCESGQTHEVQAPCVINAAGPAVGAVLALDGGDAGASVQLSRGSHVVVGAGFLGGDTAVLMPRVDDGRVMFAIPWLGHTLLGTTDLAQDAFEAEPTPRAAEIDAILATAARYLARAPGRADITAMFCGLRPLAGTGGAPTAQVSREHALTRAASGLVTITGGKWTTFRRMAGATLDFALAASPLAAGPSRTADCPLTSPPMATAGPHLPGLACTEAACRAAVRETMARRTEDMLARRCRALFTDARAALAAAPRVAAIVGEELGRSAEEVTQDLAAFRRLAARYIVDPVVDPGPAADT